MIEIEVYARGLRAESRLLELRGQMDMQPHVRYKVDAHHDLVYFELDEPAQISLKDIMEVFTNIGLEPRLVGQVPEGVQ
ncbi:hypothetical protein WJU23_12055 [Prosthecobacter sp. SYSU 5D2]|uniref:hypothetical protein n=1 Tax=Prosthecobacter sp. SYSU 5D2 TaxID=3134134 RepID=UPI0031FE49B3